MLNKEYLPIEKLFLIDGFISLVTGSFVFQAEFCAHFDVLSTVHHSIELLR
jgi:hypothetical protein